MYAGDAYAAAPYAGGGGTAAAAAEPLRRSGFGLVLASTAAVFVTPPVDVDAASTALHVVTPTVPVPTLVNGRPS